MKRNITLIQSIVACVLSVAITSCEKKGPEKAGVGTHSDSVSYGVPSSSAQVDSTTHASVVDTALGTRAVPLSSGTGTLTVKVHGLSPGEWKFDDVTATLSEKPVAGATENLLQIEAHKVPPDNHLKLFFRRKDGPIELGRYSIDKPDGDPPRLLDGIWEHTGQRFQGLAGATGYADVTTLTADRVAGTYDIMLVPLAPKGVPEKLDGSFDMRLQK